MKNFYLIIYILYILLLICSIIMCFVDFHWYWLVIGLYTLGIIGYTSEDYILYNKDCDEPKKVYGILYNAHEFDDIETGDLTPIFLSLSSDTCNKEYQKLYEQNKNHFNQYRQLDDFFDIGNNEFEYSIGNWVYHYKLVNYDLDKNFQY